MTIANNNRTVTAFKHPRCGGIVYIVTESERVYYQCDKCLESAEQVEQLAIGKPVILRRGTRSNTRP